MGLVFYRKSAPSTLPGSYLIFGRLVLRADLAYELLLAAGGDDYSSATGWGGGGGTQIP